MMEDQHTSTDEANAFILQKEPTDAEIRELLYYFQGVASRGARRQVIAKARMCSRAPSKAVSYFEQSED